jgi:hypothetical protein
MSLPYFSYLILLLFDKTLVQDPSITIASNKLEETVKITPAGSTDSLDDNYDLYKSMKGVEVDLLEAEKVLRKVDVRILSMLVDTYFLQYLDKNSISLASVYVPILKAKIIHGSVRPIKPLRECVS